VIGIITSLQSLVLTGRWKVEDHLMWKGRIELFYNSLKEWTSNEVHYLVFCIDFLYVGNMVIVIIVGFLIRIIIIEIFVLFIIVMWVNVEFFFFSDLLPEIYPILVLDSWEDSNKTHLVVISSIFSEAFPFYLFLPWI